MEKMNRRLVAVIFGAIMSLSLAITPARADFGCEIAPAHYLAFDGAFVLVRIDGKPVKICSFVASMGDLSAETCKVWLSHIMTARASNRPVWFLFHESQAGGATSCAQFTAWSSAPPFFMEAR